MIQTIKIIDGGWLINGNMSIPDNPENRHYQEVQDAINGTGDYEDNPVIVEAEFTETELEQQSREQWKRQRAQLVSEIKVTTAAGNEFDGDETSQTRMSRAMAVMSSTDTTTWVLANNTPISVTKAELKEALKLAGEAQTLIWIQ